MKQPSHPPARRTATQSAPGWISVSRGAALGISMISAFNLCEVLQCQTSAVTNWLCNFRMISQPLCIALLAMLATALLMYSIKPALPGSVWIASIAMILLVAVFTGWDLWEFTQRVPENLRQTAMSRPLGVLMLLSVAGMGILAGDSPGARGKSSILTIGFSCVLSILGFAVITLQSGSMSDVLAKEPAPAILVIGCDVAADGTPSEALVDRMSTACKVLLDGHAKMMILSGGPGEGMVTESQAMQKLAIESGVSETQVVQDSTGISFPHAIQFAADLPELQAERRIIVVSHWYQLARLRLLARQAGFKVHAIPAEQQHALFHQNILYVREIAAFLKACCEPAKRLIMRN